MALTPITEEEFVKIASEEGIPLPLASAIWNNESSMGSNPGAFIDPRLKAGKSNNKEGTSTWNSNPDKIGYGSMQVIKPTFEGVMPGVDYYSATDADLTRAGMRVLKPAVKSDGSFDLQKAKNLYFGTGRDASFGGFSPSTDPKLDRRMKQIIEAVQTNDSGDTLKGVISTALGQKSAPTLGPSLATQEVEVKKNQAQELVQFDPVAAQAKFDEAKAIESDRLKAILDNQLEGQQRILNEAGMNPYGVYAEAQETFEALKGANARLRATVQDKHFQTKPANEGMLGVLELFARKVASDKIYPSAVAEVNSLQKAAGDYQAVLNSMMVNGARGSETLSDAINIGTAASKAGAEALSIDFKTIQVDQKNAQVGMANLRADARAQEVGFNQQLKSSQAELKAAKDASDMERNWMLADQRVKDSERNYELNVLKFDQKKATDAEKAANARENIGFKSRQIAALEQRIILEEKRANTSEKTEELRQSKLRLGNLKLERELLTDYGTTDMDALSAAANAVTGQTRRWDVKEINATIGKNKDLHAQFMRVLASGGNSSQARSPDVAGNLEKIKNLGTPSERVAAGGIQKSFEREYRTELARAGLTPIATDKQRGEAESKAKSSAILKISGAPTPETNFAANPINVHPMEYWIGVAGLEGGLADTLKAAKIDASRMSGDAELVTTLMQNQMLGKLGVSQEQLLSQLLSYYKTLASTRATDKVIYEANLPVPDDQYLISTAKGGVANLSSVAGIINYAERTKSGRSFVQKLRETSTPASANIMDAFKE